MTTTITYPVLTEEQFATMTMDEQSKMQYPQMTYEEARRPISSVILSEEVLGEAPPDHTVRYVEVPIIEEVVKHVPVKSVVEVEKIVPRYEVEYVEKIVEVPEILYIDTHVEKEHIQEVVREVPGETEIREVNRTLVRKVPKVQMVNVEKIVEVPGEIIDVTKQHVETLPHIKRYHDVEVPIVVAQTIRPVIRQSDECVDVDVFEYEPQITPVDVYVATPIGSKLVAVGGEQDVHNCVPIPPAQYNTILKSLNAHISDKEAEQLPFIKTNGTVGFLSPTEAPGYVPLEPSTFVTQQNVNSVKQYPEEMSEYPGSINQPTPSYDLQEGDRQSTGMGTSSAPMKKAPRIQDKKKRICGC